MAELVLFVGLQASGKSSYFRQRFFKSHVRINLDMLKTRHREDILIQACLAAQQPCVIDNTNPTREDRARYLGRAKTYGFKTVGYYFASSIEACLNRNAKRNGDERIPDAGLLGTFNRLELPNYAEGFDELYYVRLDGQDGFIVEDWSDEI